MLLFLPMYMYLCMCVTCLWARALDPALGVHARERGREQRVVFLTSDKLIHDHSV